MDRPQLQAREQTERVKAEKGSGERAESKNEE